MWPFAHGTGPFYPGITDDKDGSRYVNWNEPKETAQDAQDYAGKDIQRASNLEALGYKKL